MPEQNGSEAVGPRKQSFWERHWGLIRVMIAAGFSFSCFGLLIFVWVTFGGFLPLSSNSYRFSADFDEGISLQPESDVRVGGVSVGKVKEVSLPPDANATRVTIELEPDYAPISEDARAILRQKTLLGETFVELTTGSKNEIQIGETAAVTTAQTGSVDGLVGDDVVEAIPEDGHLADSQVEEQVQIDEIFNALDEETRTAFRVWQQNLAIASKGRALDLSDGFGNLGPFTEDATDILETLNRQGDVLSQLVNNTGTVFGALTERDQQLAGLIEGNNQTFEALASRDEALAESIKIFPTFNEEARKTLTRLQSFSVNARPLAKDLKPVARNISPTLKDVRTLTPYAKQLFIDLGPLLDAATVGLPQTRGILREAAPVLRELDPFLANLNPILRYTSAYSGNVTDFLSDPQTTQAGTLIPTGNQPAPRHVFRQIGYISPESLSIFPTRSNVNRGNGYLPPQSLGTTFSQGIRFPSHDCANTGSSGPGGQVLQNPPTNPPATPGTLPITNQPGTFPLSIFPNPVFPQIQAHAACVLTPPSPFGGGAVPYVPAD